MRITAFIGAAVLGLCMLAFAPVASMAEPAPDICILDLSQSVTLGHAIDAADITCTAMAVDVAAAAPIMPGDDDEAAATCMTKAHATFAVDGHRQHEDPGRCLS